MLNIKSNLRILMAYNGFTSLKQLGDHSGVSWEILKKLDENSKIESIRIGNLFKICRSLNCRIEDLILIPYKSKDYDYLKLGDSGLGSNLKLLMAVNNIDTMKDLMRLSGISWKIGNKLEKFIDIETLELSSVLKVCAIFKCNIQDLLNINYNYYTEEYNFPSFLYIN